MKAKLTIFFFLTCFLLTGCKRYNHSQIEGKWQVIIDEGIYYERWISGNSMIWYDSEFGIQLWTFDFDGKIISYKNYDKEKNTTSDSDLEETITYLNKDSIKINVTTNTNGVSYLMKRISSEKFTPDYTTLDIEMIRDEIKKRQYKFFGNK